MSRRDYNTWFLWTKERLEYLHEHFADNSNQSIADAIGTDIASVRNKAHRLGLKKDKAYSDMVHANNSKPYRWEKGCVVPEEVITKRVQTYKHLIKVDKIRLKYGLPQRTKIKLTNIY